MPIRMSCSACQYAFDAPEEKIGQTVICELCNSFVEIIDPTPPLPAPVIATEAGAEPAPAVEDDDGIMTAEVDEGDAAAPETPSQEAKKASVAKPVVARPAVAVAKAVSVTKPATAVAKAVATPVAKAAPTKKSSTTNINIEDSPRRKGGRFDEDRDDPRPKKKPKRRDDDDYGDEPMPKEKSGGMTGIFMAFLAVAVVAVLGVCGGLGYFFYKGTKKANEIAQNIDIPGPDDTGIGGPGSGNTTGTIKPSNTPFFKIKDTGVFTVEMPGKLAEKPNREDSTISYAGKTITGVRHKPSMWMGFENYEAMHYDLPDDNRMFDVEFIRSALPGVEITPAHNRGSKTYGGHAGTLYYKKEDGPFNAERSLWIAQVGRRVFLFTTGVGAMTDTYPANSKRFFESINITFSPTAVDPAPTVMDPASWKDIGGDAEGYTAKMPKVTGSRQNNSITVEGAEYEGKTFRSGRLDPTNPAPYEFFATVIDLSGTAKRPDMELVVLALTRTASFGAVAAPSDIKIAGLPAIEWRVTLDSDLHHFAATIQTAKRYYIFSADLAMQPGRSPTPQDEAKLRSNFDAFLKTIKLINPGEPTPPTPTPTPMPTDWVKIPDTVGFTILAPNKAAQFVPNFRIGIGPDALDGAFSYTVADDEAAVKVEVYPTTKTWTKERILAEVLNGQMVTGDVVTTKLNEEVAFERSTKDKANVQHLIRNAYKFERVYVVKVIKSPTLADDAFRKLADRVFESFRYVDNLPKLNPAPPPPVVGGNNLVFSGNIDPFWVGVALSKKKEFLAFSTREGVKMIRAGTVRRYSYPEFKSIATYHLPHIVTRAVVDEKANKLYCAIATKDSPTLSGREPVFLPGAIHVYDLKAIIDGALAENADIKPLHVFAVNGGIAGLQLSPDGQYLYAATQIPPTNNPRLAYKGRLYRFNTDKNAQEGADIEHNDAFNNLLLSKDGRKLTAIVLPIGTNLPPTKTCQVVNIDTLNWKKGAVTNVAGIVNDATFADDGLMVLSIEGNPMAGGTAKVLQIEDTGAIRAISPDTGGKIYHLIKARPDGNYAIASCSYGVDGVYLLDVRHDKANVNLVTMAFGESHDGRAIGGQVFFTPDNAQAILSSGSVIDMAKTIGR